MFKYYNNNPKGKHTCDCAIRAAALCLNKPYEDVLQELVNTSLETGYHIADPVCFSIYMTRNGYKHISLTSRDIKCNYLCNTIQSFYNSGIVGTALPYLTKLSAQRIIVCYGINHVAAIIDGVLHDTVDGTDRIISGYYIPTEFVI